MVTRAEERITHEPIVLGESKGMYDSEDIVNYVVDGKNQNRTFAEIARGLKNRGYEKITSTKVAEIYKTAVARSVIYHNTAQEKFDDFSNELQTMYSRAISVLTKLINTLEKIYDEFETSDMDQMQKYIMFIRLAPQIKMTTDQILSYLKEYKESQDKIETTKENRYLTSADILQEVLNALPTLEKTGSIKIIDDNLRKR